ncbi:MAG: ABC transporter substrate-binding protein [Alphaproteobacteria bacterium]|nr:ABC transporter substrate-binding protein [Alphaproteobacteria bacterium]
MLSVAIVGAAAAAAAPAKVPATVTAPAVSFKETPSLAGEVGRKALPAIGERLPREPSVVDLKGRGRELGTQGGVLRMLLSKEKDVRLLSAWGYARLVTWTPQLELKPDILKSIEVKDGRVFTMHLRAGHKWSDGTPFTSEDFRYFWEDVATNKDLSPKGPPVELINNGALPKVEIVDATTVRYSWTKPHPGFLAALAQAREPYIYRPAHYLKQFHAKYAVAAALAAKVAAGKVRSWAQLHNRLDSMDNNDNPALPTLQPWVATTAMPANRFVFKRNPFFHRVDSEGKQLPYIDGIEITIADAGLIAAKAAAGDADLQARGLSLADITVLKANEANGRYKVVTWPIAKGSQLALYPNLNANDPVWRKLMREPKFRRALSLGIDRSDINRALFFGLATEGNNTVLKSSPLFRPSYLSANAGHDAKTAGALLDELGLKQRNAEGTRLMADGRALELIVENAGEAKEESDVLQLIAQHYKAIGVKLVIKPSDRTVMRSRAYAGEAVMTAWAGWDTGIPTPEMSPDELAPTRQDTLNWPKWGQYFESNGAAGEAPDIAAAQELLKLSATWSAAKTPAERKAVWEKMLQIHAEQQFIIGTVSGVMQPIVVRTNLHNVPEQGVFSWDPGAQFGMYRMDEFWFGK